ncbi:conserved hypothetical protein [Magnetospirillum sp. LM-5]|uniref:HNH endonuclease n=1 Tax=Magnetospirillum sp. LM-5 TaxID=2681466 RepID=UPI0013862252|nr:HNH endonuclease [Magnetospirillum sp. LM-5]CAA7613251.1 conserved hypothetical protein [Magnetospirillum sp. LM-5]
MTDLPAWRRARCQRLWEEQHGNCFFCGRPMPEPMTQRVRHRKRACAATIEHVVPRSAGGAADWSNEVAACHACNAAKADQPPTEEQKQKLALLKAFPLV